MKGLFKHLKNIKNTLITTKISSLTLVQLSAADVILSNRNCIFQQFSLWIWRVNMKDEARVLMVRAWVIMVLQSKWLSLFYEYALEVRVVVFLAAAYVCSKQFRIISFSSHIAAVHTNASAGSIFFCFGIKSTRIYATHSFIPTEFSSGYAGRSMGQLEDPHSSAYA